ncbi:MAG: ATP-binding protein [Planctomycetota bacterium]
MDLRARVESLASSLESLPPGRLHCAALPDGPGVLLARVSDDGLRCAGSFLSHDWVMAILGEAVPLEGFSESLIKLPLGGSPTAAALPEPLDGFTVLVTAAPDLVRERMRPWRVAVLIAIAAVLATSVLSALLAVRSVRRQLELAALRRDLVTSISHDLRTPLTGMLLRLEMLGDERLSEEACRHQATRARESAARLKMLVDRILDFGRTEGGGVLGPKTVERPAELVTFALAEMQPLLADCPVTRDVPDDLPLVHVDREAVVQVLVSLIDNAAKHTPLATPIRVTAQPYGGRHVEIAVEDEGPGVPEAERHRLGEPFYRGPDSSAVPGLGLGLAIARRITEALGGELAIEAAARGAVPEGLRVNVRLPTAAEETK